MHSVQSLQHYVAAHVQHNEPHRKQSFSPKLHHLPISRQFRFLWIEVHRNPHIPIDIEPRIRAPNCQGLQSMLMIETTEAFYAQEGSITDKSQSPSYSLYLRSGYVPFACITYARESVRRYRVGTRD
jgi:hypothetical protein